MSNTLPPIAELRKIAERELRKSGLDVSYWGIEVVSKCVCPIDPTLEVCGYCTGAGLIRIGVAAHTKGFADFMDTILHELAHAFALEESGISEHDETWIRHCKRLGAEWKSHVGRPNCVDRKR